MNSNTTDELALTCFGKLAFYIVEPTAVVYMPAWQISSLYLSISALLAESQAHCVSAWG